MTTGPATGGPPLICRPAELRTLFLFEKLTDEQLQWLCERGHVELLEPGTVYAEGAPATCFYVLLEGTVVLSRRVGADDIEVGRTSTRGVCTPEPSWPTWATRYRRSITTRCG